MRYLWLALSAALFSCAVSKSYRPRFVKNRVDSALSDVLSEMAVHDTQKATDDEAVVNYQNMASHTHFDHDNAPKPFYTQVDDSVLSRPTFAALNNVVAQYKIRDASQPDENSPARLTAANSFLDELAKTEVFQLAFDYLQSTGVASSSLAAFKQQLLDLWFTVFARQTALGSSGFKTVFVGESLGGDVVGLTNWLRFQAEEKAGRINYHGWFSRQKGVQVSLQFAWDADRAVERSFLLNVSPEFEFLAYSVCALSRESECELSINGQGVVLVVETRKSGDVTVIDSAYPSMGGVGPKTTTKGPTKAPAPPGALVDLVNAMRAADVDRARDSQYKLDWGPKVGQSVKNDLFVSVDESVFTRPVYKALRVVYDQKLLTADVCTAEPAFDSGFRKSVFLNILDTWMATDVFKLAHKYLVHQGKASPDVGKFRDYLFVLWFGTYSRCKGPLGSSGFEHVYSGEWKSGTVDGQHNWMRYYLLQKDHRMKYEGHYSFDAQLTGTFKYMWEDELKKTGGFLIGTSPAFDFSLLTMCAMSHPGANGCKFNIDGFALGVTSYTQSCQNGGTCISTAYPTN